MERRNKCTMFALVRCAIIASVCISVCVTQQFVCNVQHAYKSNANSYESAQLYVFTGQMQSDVRKHMPA